MRLKYLRISDVLLIALLLVGLTACSHEATPESRIKALIYDGEQAAEDRDLDYFKATISQEYTDGKGLSRDEFLQMLAGYFYRNRSIHLVSRIEDVMIGDDGKARAVVLVGMAGSPVEGFEQLLSLRADLYRLNLEFDMGEDIQLQHAQWERVNPEEILSEL